MVIAISTTQARAQHSDARQWNELLLESIRNDFARPTVHARNLYHVSTAMWDAWATYDQTADCVLFDESHATTNPAIDAWRSEALSYASYRIMTARFTTSPGAPVMLPQYDALLVTLGYNAANTTTIGNTPAAIGNRIAATVLAFGAGDNSNEAGDYANQYYNPVNLALLPDFPGNPNLGYPNRWQPLSPLGRTVPPPGAWYASRDAAAGLVAVAVAVVVVVVDVVVVVVWRACVPPPHRCTLGRDGGR